MRNRPYIEAIPAYYAKTDDGRCVPFIIALLFYNKAGKICFPPAVERAINKTIEVTQREGLATATITDKDAFTLTAKRYLERAMTIPGAIVLLSCQSPETAERLMQFLNTNYQLSLVREVAP
ncbi:MAG: hypothetical protein IT497_04755 [Ottowia sp.]|nr:hypothetical protein [Ottowia sp.]